MRQEKDKVWSWRDQSASPHSRLEAESSQSTNCLELCVTVISHKRFHIDCVQVNLLECLQLCIQRSHSTYNYHKVAQQMNKKTLAEILKAGLSEVSATITF